MADREGKASKERQALYIRGFRCGHPALGLHFVCDNTKQSAKASFYFSTRHNCSFAQALHTYEVPHSMNQRLGKFDESQVVTVNDDAQAQTLMLELGVWDQMTKEVTPSTTVTMVIADNHPTHWCLCARHRNNPDPKENGFQVIAYPKSTVDRFAVQMVLQQYLSRSTELSVELFDPKPLD